MKKFKVTLSIKIFLTQPYNDPTNIIHKTKNNKTNRNSTTLAPIKIKNTNHSKSKLTIQSQLIKMARVKSTPRQKAILTLNPQQQATKKPAKGKRAPKPPYRTTAQKEAFKKAAQRSQQQSQTPYCCWENFPSSFPSFSPSILFLLFFTCLPVSV